MRKGQRFCDQHAHHLLQLGFHRRGQVGPRLAEVLEVGGREHQHLAGAVVAEEVVALLARLDKLAQCRKSSFSCLGLLREQVVGDAHRQLAGVGQLLDRLA